MVSSSEWEYTYLFDKSAVPQKKSSTVYCSLRILVGMKLGAGIRICV